MILDKYNLKLGKFLEKSDEFHPIQSITALYLFNNICLLSNATGVLSNATWNLSNSSRYSSSFTLYPFDFTLYLFTFYQKLISDGRVYTRMIRC